MRQGKIRYVFPGSNTPAGFHSFYEEGLKGIDRIFILKGGPGVGKSTLMRKIGTAMADRGYDVEFWQCSSDNDSLDGVLIQSLSVAVIDGTAPHVVDPRYPGAIDEIINLGEHWNDAYLREHRKEIVDLTGQVGDRFVKGYDLLSQAGQLRTQWEKIYYVHVNHHKITTEAEHLMDEIFCQKTPATRHLFASAVTPKGFMTFAENLTAPYPRRYILQGAPGCGKSILLAKIAQAAESRGHAMEVYHNTFAPERIELLLFPDLGVAIWDVPYEYKVTLRKDDKILNGSDFLNEIPTLSETETILMEKFHMFVDEAAKEIAQAKVIHDKLETYYNKAMDFEAVDETGTALFNKILNIIADKEKTQTN